MIKGAIFDVDGTILDSMAIWEEAGERYLNSIGLESKAGFRESVFSMTLKEAVFYTKEQYHLQFTEEEITEAILAIVRDFYYDEVQAKSGVVRFLTELKKRGIVLTVATSSERELVERAFERIGILDYFGKIFTCSEIGTGKNSPLIYQKAAEYMGTIPEETAIFEDAMHAVKTAAGAGFVTIGVADDYSRKNESEIRKYAACFIEDWNRMEDFYTLKTNAIGI